MADLSWLISLAPQTTDGSLKLVVWGVSLFALGIGSGLWITNQRVTSSEGERNNLQSRIDLRDDQIQKLESALAKLHQENTELRKETFQGLRTDVDRADTDSSKIAALVELIDALATRVGKLEEPSDWAKMVAEANKPYEIGPEVRRVKVEALPGCYTRLLNKVSNELQRERPEDGVIILGASSPKQEEDLISFVDICRRSGFRITELPPERTAQHAER